MADHQFFLVPPFSCIKKSGPICPWERILALPLCPWEKNSGPPSVSHTVICDGRLDCQSGDDESNCGCDATLLLSEQVYNQCLRLPIAIRKSCHPFEFICPNERCIPYTFVCDGIPHCKNKADEFCHVQIFRNSIGAKRKMVLTKYQLPLKSLS